MPNVAVCCTPLPESVMLWMCVRADVHVVIHVFSCSGGGIVLRSWRVGSARQAAANGGTTWADDGRSLGLVVFIFFCLFMDGSFLLIWYSILFSFSLSLSLSSLSLSLAFSFALSLLTLVCSRSIVFFKVENQNLRRCCRRCPTAGSVNT